MDDRRTSNGLDRSFHIKISAASTLDAIAMIRRVAFVVLALFLIAEAVALGVRLAPRSAPYDDAFITFRYARNFAEGKGFVYNPGDHYLGTTAPPFGLLLGVLARVSSLDPEWWANWLSACAIALAAWFAFRLVLVDFGLVPAVTAGLSVALNPMMMSSWGGEWLVAVAVMAGGFYFYRRDRVMVAAVAFSLAILLRSEAAIGVAMVYGDALLRRKRGAVRAIGLSAAIGLGWVIVAWLVVGQVLPGTLATKLAHARSGLFQTLLAGFLRGIRQFILADYRMVAVALLAWHGALLAVFKRGVWWLIGLWLAAHMAFYTWLRLPFYDWYLVPVAFGISVAAGIGASAVEFYLRALIKSRVVARLTAAVVVVLLVGTALAAEVRSSRDWIRAQPDPREVLYNQVGTWLAQNTPPDASVAYLEIGRIGYFSRRRIVDVMGLVTPLVAEHVAKQDLLWSIYHYQPDYYLTSSVFTWAGTLAGQPWFQRAYREVARFTPTNLETVLTIYEKQPGAIFPPPPETEALQLSHDGIVGEILPGTSHGQTFTASTNGLSGVATLLATMARTNKGRMRFRLEQLDPSRLIVEEPFEMESVADNQWREFRFPPLADSQGKRYRLTIEALDAAAGNAITIWYASGNAYRGGERLINNAPVQGDLTLRLFYGLAGQAPR
jgi:hypothetical protein